MPRTRGFSDKKLRLRHWSDHGQDFATAITVAQYEAMADRFLSQALCPTMIPCNRKHGDHVRYDQATGTFGVLSADGIIRTYFKPVPCAWIPPAFVNPRWCHAHADNITYFRIECAK